MPWGVADGDKAKLRKAATTRPRVGPPLCDGPAPEMGPSAELCAPKVALVACHAVAKKVVAV